MGWKFEFKWFDELYGRIEFIGTHNTVLTDSPIIEKIEILDTKVSKFICDLGKEYYSITFTYCAIDYDVPLTRQQMMLYLQWYSSILQRRLKTIIENQC